MPGFLEDLDIQRNAAHRDGFDPEPPPPRRRDAGLLRTLTLAVAFSAALIAARPRAASFPSRIASLRAKQRQPTAYAQLSAEFAKKDSLLSKFNVGFHEFDEAAPTSGDSDAAPSAAAPKTLWVAEIAVASLGCTRRTCFVGAAGSWWQIPKWSKDTDVFVLAGLHALACATFHYDVAAYYRHFAPRWSRPQSLVLGIFGVPSPWELLWLITSLVNYGPELQRALGRLGFVHLYLAAGLASTVAGLMLRCGGTGAAGVLAHLTFHVCRQPSARHTIFGVTLPAPAALAVQVGFASWQLLQTGGAVAVLAVSGTPCALGAAAHFLRLKM